MPVTQKVSAAPSAFSASLPTGSLGQGFWNSLTDAVRATVGTGQEGSGRELCGSLASSAFWAPGGFRGEFA